MDSIMMYNTLLGHVDGQAFKLIYVDKPSFESYSHAISKLCTYYYNQSEWTKELWARRKNLGKMNKTTKGVRRVLNEAISIRNELLSRKASKDDFLELIMLEHIIYPTLDDEVKEKIDNARTRARNGGATWGHDLKWSRNGPHKGIVEIIEEYEERLAGSEQANNRDKKARMKERMHSQNTNRSQIPMLMYNGDTNNSHNTNKPDFDYSKTGMPTNKKNPGYCPVWNCNERVSRDHCFIIKCKHFKAMTGEEAFNLYKELGSKCRMCLGEDHKGKNCKLTYTCQEIIKEGPRKGEKCEGRHLQKLHYARDEVAKPSSSKSKKKI